MYKEKRKSKKFTKKYLTGCILKANADDLKSDDSSEYRIAACGDLHTTKFNKKAG